MKQKYSVWTSVCDEHKFLLERVMLQLDENRLSRFCCIEDCDNNASVAGYTEITVTVKE